MESPEHLQPQHSETAQGPLRLLFTGDFQSAGFFLPTNRTLFVYGEAFWVPSAPSVLYVIVHARG